jgi:hypothetical protein
MNVAAISSLAQAQTMQQVDMAVARKSLDATKAQGDAAVSLIQAAADLQQQMVRTASANPNVGVNLDVVA